MNDNAIAEELLGTERPCPDLAIVVGSCTEDSVDHVLETGEPTILPTTNGNLVLMTERAYKYFLSKCTEDELWDLGFLGASEKHARPVDVPLLWKTLTK